MGKHEAPAFRMLIEGGRLVPATAYDQERLESYRRGTKVSVRLTEEKDRVLVRKWWAIIGKAVKECATPWKTRDEASEAIKLSLGIVNLAKTVGGDWMQYPKSLTKLTDPELVEAVEGMAAIIQHITGVDPDDWKKEIADVGENEPSEADAPANDAGRGIGEASASSAADPSDAGNGVDEGAGDTEAADSQSASPALALSDEDRAWLKLVAKMLWAATGVGEQDVLRNQFAGIRDNHTPDTIGKLARDKGMSISNRCKLVCFGEKSAGEILPEIAMIAGCDVKDIA